VGDGSRLPLHGAMRSVVGQRTTGGASALIVLPLTHAVHRLLPDDWYVRTGLSRIQQPKLPAHVLQPAEPIAVTLAQMMVTDR
jgi:hypothetical protein